MAYTREFISQRLDPNVKPQFTPYTEEYLGRKVPSQLFPIQDWCFAQGADPEHLSPDLTHVLQGVEYILQAATGNFPEAMTADQIGVAMPYLNCEEDFENGALRQYPELQQMMKKAILTLPKGKEVINTIRSFEQYQDLFSD